MADPTDIGQVPGNPWPTTNNPPDELTMQALLVSTGKRIGAMPTDYSGSAGQLLVVAADESGPTVLGGSGVGAIDLGGLGVTGNAIAPVTITGNGPLTWAAHLGQELVYAGTSSITLTLNLDATGLLGVKDRFQCLVARAYDSGSVGQLHLALGAGLTLQRADGNLGIAPGGVVSVRVIGTRVFLTGSVVA